MKPIRTQPVRTEPISTERANAPPTAETSPTVERRPTSETPPYSTWLLETLFTGQHRHWQGIASQVFGLLGLAVYASGTTIGAVGLIELANSWGNSSISIWLCACAVQVLAISLSYVSILFALHWFASCQFWFTVRLALVYALIYSCLRIAFLSNNEQIAGIHVLMIVPMCISGFIQHRRGWSALPWSQTYTPPGRLSVRDFLDLTASIALTLAMTQTAEFRVASLACLIPASLLMATAGIHVWSRLTTLCSNSVHRTNGFAIWIAGNAMVALVLFLYFAMTSRQTPVGLLGILVAPLLLVGIHYWTLIPISWLRVCGWRFESAESDAVLFPISATQNADTAA